MQPQDVLREMIRARGLTTRAASAKFGRSSGYVSRMLASGSNPTASNLSSFADALEFDLLLRDRTDGTEIIIDAPPRD